MLKDVALATWNFVRTSGSDVTVGICFFRWLVSRQKKCWLRYIFLILFYF